MIKFYDTNALLDLQEEAFNEFFLCADVTLKELENIKTSNRKSEDVKRKARKLSHLLDEHFGEYEVCIGSQKLKEDYKNSPDEQIVELADLYRDLFKDGYYVNNEVIKDEVVFVTNDICCKNIARLYKLKVESTNDTKARIYKGYKEISGSTEYINEYMSSINYDEWSVNEYLLIHNTDDNTHKEMRFDGSKFVSLKLPASKYIKGKNSLQRCALDAMMNTDITIVAILGGYGSGKTFLAVQMALYAVKEKGNQSKILGVREPWGEGKNIGYLPGDFSDKTDLFFQPLVQQLRGGEFELNGLIQQGILDYAVPYFMKGTTYNDTVIVCDEAEDLSDKQLRLVGTRLGDNSKIFFSGDYKQSLLNQTTGNALVRMCNEFKGNPKFACIYLGEDVRSETSKMFADLFNE